jgi:hypothetical protein
MQLIRIFIFVVTFIFNCSMVQAMNAFIDASVYFTDAKTTTLAWDGPAEGSGIPDRYEIQEESIETGIIRAFTTANLSVDIPKNRTGHFKYRLRACADSADPVCTVWVESIDKNAAALWTDGVFIRLGGWIVYKQLSPIIME